MYHSPWSDDRFERLVAERDQLRYTVLNLAPERFRSLLSSYYRCETRSDLDHWFNDTIPKIVEMTEPLWAQAEWPYARRAYCPLCESGSSSSYEQGFALPEGLERHLRGASNTHECPVMRVARDCARAYREHRFGKEEQLEREEAERVRAERFRTEPLFTNSPWDDPELWTFDREYEPMRNTAEIKWAVSRLISLGFTQRDADRVRSFVREDSDRIVYADPRTRGRISFCAYPKPLPKRAPTSVRSKHRPVIFAILDRWKNDLAAKYERLLAQGRTF